MNFELATGKLEEAFKNFQRLPEWPMAGEREKAEPQNVEAVVRELLNEPAVASPR